jgi:hypothetical protein
MKLEVGMYYRDIDGNVDKIRNYGENQNNVMWYTINNIATMKGGIKKASFNIIDLIEVGDILTIEIMPNQLEKLEVELFLLHPNDDIKIKGVFNGKKYLSLYQINIKEILTKEQYERLVYKI